MMGETLTNADAFQTRLADLSSVQKELWQENSRIGPLGAGEMSGETISRKPLMSCCGRLECLNAAFPELSRGVHLELPRI